jgi:hypothetical protein
MGVPSLHMNNENCEPRIRFTTQRGRQGFALIAPLLHVFLPTPTWGVGGERSETEGGISAMVPLSIRDALSLLAVIEDFFIFIL